jgi:hypothetical protein
LEEYENLKRLPEQRQSTMQRVQQQQQLNEMIARQQQQSTGIHRTPNGQLTQIWSDMAQSIPGTVAQRADYLKLLAAICHKTADGQQVKQMKRAKLSRKYKQLSNMTQSMYARVFRFP